MSAERSSLTVPTHSQRGELDDASEPFTKSSDDGELEEAPGPVTSV